MGVSAKEHYHCCRACTHCKPANGKTNCPFFNEYLDIVEWWGVDKVRQSGCFKFEWDEESLDFIVNGK